MQPRYATEGSRCAHLEPVPLHLARAAVRVPNPEQRDAPPAVSRGPRDADEVGRWGDACTADIEGAPRAHGRCLVPNQLKVAKPKRVALLGPS